MRIVRYLSLAALLLFASCTAAIWTLRATQLDILDAARIYAENPEVFESVRTHFPGPFAEPLRIPAFSDSDNNPENSAFLEELRKSIPVEILRIFTWDDDNDKIEIVFDAFGLAVSGGSVSVFYFEEAFPEKMKNPNLIVFDTCDVRALEWLREHGSKASFADVYCRLNDHWYAYEGVT